MAIRNVTVGRHTITVDPIGLKAKITYDGKLISNPSGINSALGIFHVVEDGEDIQYDVEMRARIFTVKVVIRRNGRIIYSD